MTDEELIKDITKKYDFDLGGICGNKRAILVSDLPEIISLCKLHFEQEWNSLNTPPVLGQMVALIDFNRHANNGATKVDNEYVNTCGYLHEFGGKHWCVYGERGIDFKAFTHWHPLPPSSPENKDERD